VTPLLFTLITFAISTVAGVLGSLLGLGGGIIVVPALTLLLRIDIRYAIGASIVSVIATSSGAAAAYVRERMTNLRVAMFLELGTTTGALSGAYAAGWLGGRWLYIIFGVMMGYSAFDRLRLHGSYFDPAVGREISYRVTHTKLGLVLMYGAGVVSGLLGIGSGALKVPAMDLAMRMPIKTSTATSNFMIGVTADATAGVYFARGDIDPFVAAPVAVGVLLGATLGSRLLGKLQSSRIRLLFVAVLLWISAQMLWKGMKS
jgi:uncharacterized membrane protein YfcA